MNCYRALVWYPRLCHGTSEERNHVEIFGDGTQIHWPILDEDLPAAGLLADFPSSENTQPLKRWVEGLQQNSLSRND